MGRIIAIQTGSTLVSPAVPNKQSRLNPLAYTGLLQRRKNRITVPVKGFLVEVQGHKLLVDTGWSARDAKHSLKHLGFPLWFSSEPVLTVDDAVIPTLAKENITKDDIDAVAMTHLDCDHIAGVDALIDKQIFVSSEELVYANEDKLRYNKSLWKGAKFTTLDFREDINAPFGQSADIFGDKSIMAYLVPGHSKGSVVYIARENNRYFAIVGDTGYNQKSWTELKLPGVIYNKENLLIGLEWIRNMLADENCAGVFAAHDPHVGAGTYDISNRLQDSDGLLI